MILLHKKPRGESMNIVLPKNKSSSASNMRLKQLCLVYFLTNFVALFV